MKINNAVAFVTGANRGLGLAFARALVAGGARKVYGAARDPDAVTLEGVTPIRLDVTNAQEIAAAARACGDVDLLINNAGISRGKAFLAADSLEGARAEFEANFFGPLEVTKAFAPALARNGGGAIINVLSALSWVNFPSSATYGASKAAAWALTNGLRNELRGQATQVLALHVGYMDIDMTVRLTNIAKSRPEDVVQYTLDVLETGGEEALADDVSRNIKKGLSAEPGVYITVPGK
jgi:NAD(P)-dependent dehydrogenase (short-subunit alcohol dehydrogenase family)